MKPLPDSLNKAAVLVPTFREKEKDYFLFTLRTEEVLHHKGQVCFPGGAADPQDRNLWETALRETMEEIGLDPTDVHLIRELNPHVTPTGFHVTPFLASIPVPTNWRPNPHEIAEVFSVPASHLKDPRNVRFGKQIWNDIEFINPVFSFNSHRIWGMTGRILCDVLEIKLP